MYIFMGEKPTTGIALRKEVLLKFIKERYFRA